jgi:peptidoglycan/LPS O-acetylase OafA/YrhL
MPATRANSFDALRHVGALLVLVGHSFVLVGRPAPAIAGIPIHTLGLFVFFSISGYLVTGSFVADPDWPRYLAKRALRIFPALAVVLLFTAFVIGPLATAYRVDHYLRDKYVWLFLVRNVVLWHDDWLPGVFEQPPFDGAANGSLWTLPIEFGLYLTVPLAVGAARGARLATAGGLALLAGAAAIAGYLGPPTPWRIYHVDPIQALQLAPLFLCGAALRLLGSRIALPLAWAGVAGAAFLATGLLPDPANYVWGFAPLAVLVVAVGSTGLLASPMLHRTGDLSYGIYLIAWPLQGLIIRFVGQAGRPARQRRPDHGGRTRLGLVFLASRRTQGPGPQGLAAGRAGAQRPARHDGRARRVDACSVRARRPRAALSCRRGP